MTFDETIGPSRVDNFLSTVWGRHFLHIPGESGRFRSLLPWAEINRMLQQHRLEPPRLRLVRKGEFAPKTSYLRYEGRVPFVVPEKLAARMREGYTLIIDAVDDMTTGVMRIAEDFERVLRESVQVNLYAGWREQQGFHRHCDTHDVIVLQVYGRKHWRVYAGGRPHPLKNDVVRNEPAPDQVIFDAILEEGDVLYLPRGWWHEASAIGELTLHLTFGIHQRTGVGLMHWLADELRHSEAFRAPLLRFGTAEEKARQFAVIRRELAERLDDDVIERWLDQQDVRARTRGWANLPWSAEEDALLPLNARVALATARPLLLTRDNGSVAMEANGRSWRFASAAQTVLDALERERGQFIALSALCKSAESLDPDTVRRFVGELAREGLVNVEGEPGR